MKKIFAASLAITAAVLATSASAQVVKDSESFAIALSGTVASNCELTPEGSGSYNVNMLDVTDQGLLAITYACNSPYTVSLQSQNGGMRHQESNGAVLIDYDIDSSFLGFNRVTVNSANMKSAPATIVTDSDWKNIALNGGARQGDLGLSFDNLAEYAVAGTYSDTLTIKLAANF
ncbi:hypothetical protein RM533_05345 [Croceicoccus sp. F390]|uniref:Spore coat protein U domain-containing protein n=1 Tax=Croceicoccus esteveae TaxID=3075597 RepID=A0ABU2ZG81_9SPHN|nr:hypothetical protein [Croceicoccus sp. F390]MDT0575603.1 hypothetical protein [Croceicoccus sp. F390]